MTHWDPLVSECFNFYFSSTNCTSYKSWHLQLKLETSVTSLKLLVGSRRLKKWPRSKRKKKKKSGKNSEIVSLLPRKMLYTANQSSEKLSFILEIKLRVFVTKKLKKNKNILWFLDPKKSGGTESWFFPVFCLFCLRKQILIFLFDSYHCTTLWLVLGFIAQK